MSDREAFLQTIFRHPHDPAPRLVFADWLEEQGKVWEAEWYRKDCACGFVKTGYFLNFLSNLTGDGVGYNTGDSHGYGGGYSEHGDGDHHNHHDLGQAGGDGYGHTDGYLSPEDPQRFEFTLAFEANVMLELGSHVLVILPHGFVVCGIVGEQKGVAAWMMHNVSMICRTNGVPWDALADGLDQDKPDYRRWGDVIVHNPIMVREWKGLLP